jgi:hypothetical protein
MQAGRAKTGEWLLEYEPEAPSSVEPLMGYTSSVDMKRQIKLYFDSREEAVAYCVRNGIAYQVYEPQELTPKRVSYSDNFRSGRTTPWTH